MAAVIVMLPVLNENAMSTSNTAEHYIARDSFSRFQILAISLCALINVFDGFDALAIAYTAPAISMEWSLSPGALGVVFSAGFFGMAIGANHEQRQPPDRRIHQSPASLDPGAASLSFVCTCGCGQTRA